MGTPGNRSRNHYFIGGDDDTPNIIEIGKASDTIFIAGTIQQAIPAGPEVSDPTGVIQMFAGSVAPLGWLLCDGSAVSQTDYPALFGVVGTIYGNPGAGLFNLPDLRGRCPIGVGTGAGLTARALAASGGAEAITDVPAHTHTIAPRCTTDDGNVESPAGNYPATHEAEATGTTSPYRGTDNFDMASFPSGSTGLASVDTMNPFLAVNFIIRT